MRLESWPERLAEYFHSSKDTQFAWGANDCVSFAVGAYRAMTGRELNLPSWANKDDADIELEKLGGLVAAVDSVLPRVSVGYAKRGDVVLIEAGDVQWLAVCDGAYAFAPIKGRGIVTTKITHAIIAWVVD